MLQAPVVAWDVVVPTETPFTNGLIKLPGSEVPLNTSEVSLVMKSPLEAPVSLLIPEMTGVAME